ncbi:glycosyltransferase 87 family protein [Thermodesulfobacteriota bacterium]
MALIAIQVGLAVLSPEFKYGSPLEERPIVGMVFTVSVACVVFLLAVWTVRFVRPSRAVLAWVILAGLLMRLPMMVSTPMLEDDYFRYLWDGALTANGLNPYAHAPAEVELDSAKLDLRLQELAKDGHEILSRVNHPELRTIYPPVAQAAFALAYFIKPWSLIAWRVVIFMFDGATLFLLLLALRDVEASPLWGIVYWWNPLILKEIFNSAHMDVLVLPLVLGAIILGSREKYLWSSVVLALAIGVKLWPIILLPIVFRSLLRQPRRLILPLAVVGLVCAAMFIPVYLAKLDSSSGFVAYGKEWEMNDALYMVLFWAVKFLLKLCSVGVGAAHEITRAAVGLLLLAWIIWLIRLEATGSRQLWEQVLLITAGLFLLSPTQFPWYYSWVIPLIAVRPRASLLLLNGLLPLYYLRFHFDARNTVYLFDYGIVWLEFVPVWILLLWEFHSGTERSIS